MFGSTCDNVSHSNYEYISCDSPSGTGQLVPISVLSRVSDLIVIASEEYMLLGYAGPELTGVFHQHCISDKSNESVSLCPRAGGALLTITGTNFGSNYAMVLVGNHFCNEVVHDAQDPNGQVTCELPLGYSTGEAVLFVQNGGAVAPIRNVLVITFFSHSIISHISSYLITLIPVHSWLFSVVVYFTCVSHTRSGGLFSLSRRYVSERQLHNMCSVRRGQVQLDQRSASVS